jgi:hypothetical protein
VFTDGYFSTPSMPFRTKMLWLVTDNGPLPDFGLVARFEDKAKKISQAKAA